MATEQTLAETRYCSACGSEISADAEVCPECGVPREDTSELNEREPSSRVLAALVGGVASFFLGWIPVLGPTIGGGVAGYLRGPNVEESALTGTLANVLASIPSALLAVLFLVLGGLGAVADGDSSAALGLVMWLLIFAVGFVYFYAFGALGGVIGAKITDRSEPDLDDDAITASA